MMMSTSNTATTSHTIDSEKLSLRESPAIVSNGNSPSTTSSYHFSHPYHHHHPYQTSSQSLPNHPNMTLTRRGSTVSCSIPITHNQSSMRRTASETQLYEDEVEADYKDYLFYSRVVNGILSQHDDPSLLKQETQQCLQNIVRARHDDNNIIINDNHNDPMEQPHQHYYYATSNNHSNGSILHQQHEQLQQQQRPHRMLRFTTQALSLAEGEAEEDEEEEGIFDLEL